MGRIHSAIGCLTPAHRLMKLHQGFILYKMQEIEIVKHFIERFENEFYIDTEQWDDSGKNRIDLIITHKQRGFQFGIEAKNGKTKKGTEAFSGMI